MRQTIRAAVPPRPLWVPLLHLLAVGCLLLGLIIPPAVSVAPSFAQTTGGATLSILAQPVGVSLGGSGSFSSAQDGQTLAVNDEVQTGDGGVALLTFFDGSETQLTPDSTVQLTAPQAGSNGTNLFQSVGTTVNHVQQQASQGGFQTTTPSASALVRGTSYVVNVQSLAVTGCTSAPPTTPTSTSTETTAPTATAVAVVTDDEGNVRIGQSEYVDDQGELWEDDTWQDPSTGQTWDTYTDLGPAQSAQAWGLAQAVLTSIPTGTPTSTTGCGASSVPQTTVSLLTDQDGHVGQVVVSSSAPVGAAAAPASTLSATCQVSSSTGVVVVNGTLNGQVCASLQASQSNLQDVSGAVATGSTAADVAQQAGSVLGALATGLSAASQPTPGDFTQLTSTTGIPSDAGSGTGQSSTTTNSGTGNQPPGASTGQQSRGYVAPPAPNGGSSSNGSGGGGSSPTNTAMPAAAPTATPTATLPPGGVSARIGSAGGTVISADNQVSVTVPAGVVPDGSSLTIAPVGSNAPPPPPGLNGAPTYEIDATGPNGQPITQFAQPLTLTFSYTGTPPTDVAFFDGTTWQAVPTTVNTANQTVSGTTTHLSEWSVFTNASTDTPTATSTPTLAPTETPTLVVVATDTPTLVVIATDTPTDTPTLTPSPTDTPPPTGTPTLTPTPSPTSTPTGTSTLTPTPSPTSTGTATTTPTLTPTPTSMATQTTTATTTPTVTGPPPYVEGQITLPGPGTGVAVSPSMHKAWVASPSQSAVYVLDTRTDALVATIPVDHVAGSVALDRQDNALFVGKTNSTIGVVDTRSNRVAGDLRGVLPGRADALTFGAGLLYATVPSANEMVVIDPRAPSVVATVALALDDHPSYHLSPLDTNLGQIYVSDATNDTLTTICVCSYQVVALNEVSGNPSGVTVDKDTGLVFVALMGSDRVAVFDGNSVGSFVRTGVGAGTSPPQSPGLAGAQVHGALVVAQAQAATPAPPGATATPTGAIVATGTPTSIATPTIGAAPTGTPTLTMTPSPSPAGLANDGIVQPDVHTPTPTRTATATATATLTVTLTPTPTTLPVASLTEVRRFRVWAAPNALSLDHRTRRLYVLNSGDQTLEILNLNNFRAEALFNLGAAGDSIAVGRSTHRVYVTVPGLDHVVVLQDVLTALRRDDG